MDAVAVHEASHAVVALVRGVGVAYASVVATAKSAAFTRFSKSLTTVEVQDALLVVLSGPVGEAKFTGRPVELSGSDRDTARALASVLADSDEEAAVDHILHRYQILSAAAVETSWSRIQRVATKLSRCRELSSRHIADLMWEAKKE